MWLRATAVDQREGLVPGRKLQSSTKRLQAAAVDQRDGLVPGRKLRSSTKQLQATVVAKSSPPPKKTAQVGLGSTQCPSGYRTPKGPCGIPIGTQQHMWSYWAYGSTPAQLRSMQAEMGLSGRFPKVGTAEWKAGCGYLPSFCYLDVRLWPCAKRAWENMGKHRACAHMHKPAAVCCT